MKRYVLLVIAAMIGGAALWRYAEMDPGYLVIHFAGYTLETGFVLGVLLLAIVIIVLYLVVYLLSRILGMRRSLKKRQDRKVGEKLQKGMLDYIEGRYKQAQQKLQKAANNSRYPEVSLLLAARSAHRLANENDVATLLERAEAAARQDSNAVALTQYELYRDQHDWERALATLNQLSERAPELPMLRVYKAEVFCVLQDWAALEPLLDEIKRRKSLPAERFDRLERQTYLGLLSNAVDAVARNPANQEEARERLGQLWNRVPKHLRNEDAIKADYCQDLIDLGQHQEAESVIKKSLAKRYNSALVALYGKVHSDQVAKQLTTAQGWLQKQGESSVLRVTLGQLCLANELWGQAKEHFEVAIELDGDNQARLELAKLLLKQGEFKRAAELYDLVFKNS